MPNPSDVRALVDEARLRIDHHRYMAKVANECDCREDAEESDRDAGLLDRLASALEAREGWVLVPRNPTTLMKRAGAAVIDMSFDVAHDVYARMILAAPTLEPTGEGEKP